MKKHIFSAYFFLLAIGSNAQIQQDSITICGQSSYTITLQNPSSLNVWMKNGESEIVISESMTVNSSGWYHVYSSNPGGSTDISICNTFNSSNNYTSGLNIPSGYLISGVQTALWGTPNTNCANPTASSCNLDVTNIVSRSLIGHNNFQFFSGSFPDPCVGIQKWLFLKMTCSPYVHDSIYVGFLPTPNIQINDISSCDNNAVEMTLPPLICDTIIQIIDSLNVPINNSTISSLALEKGQLYRIKVKNAVSYGGGSGNQSDGAYSNYPLTPLANINWRYNGYQGGELLDFRPEPEGYNPYHTYYFYVMGDGNPQDFGAYDCCLGDNSGFYTLVIEKVIINSNCESYYHWSNGNNGNTNLITPTDNPNVLFVSNGAVSCAIDTFFVTNGNSSSTQTQSALDSYTWPVNGQTYTQSGTYSDTLINAAGCDSIVTLNLTMSYTGIEELIPNSSKKLLRITDLSGKEMPFRKNTVLLFIYEDGTVERVFEGE